MKDQIDHLRCSELLPAFLDRTLGPSDAAAVEAHLESCDECRAERRGLELLRSEETDGLSTSERGALERGVMAGIAQDPDTATVVTLPPRRQFGARVAGVLGAAAVVVVIATFFYLGVSGGDDQSPSLSGGDTQEVEDEAGRSVERSTRFNNKAGSGGGESADRGPVPAAAQDTTSSAGLRAAPSPRFRVDEKPLTGADLQKRGESSLESVTFAASYSANDARGSRTLLEQLVDAADNAAGGEVAAQVEECGGQVLDSEDPTIPTFGSVGELDGREVLVLGFAWTRRSSGPLDRYMVWAWERGSCDVLVDYVDGKIETAN